MPPSSGFLPRPLTGSRSGWFFSSQALYTAPKRSASKRERSTLGSRAAIPPGTSQAGASPWPESAAAWLITAAYWRAVTSYLPMKYSIGFSGVPAAGFGRLAESFCCQAGARSARLNWPFT